jgi:hypothetical protein
MHKSGNIGLEPGKIRDALLTDRFHTHSTFGMLKLTCDKHVTPLLCFDA